jgi:hypothetical protein
MPYNVFVPILKSRIDRHSAIPRSAEHISRCWLGGVSCTGEPKVTVPCIEMLTSLDRDITWQDAALKCVAHCQMGCYYGMWFESPCVKDTELTNGAGAAKVICPVPLLLAAIVLCLLCRLGCFSNDPPQERSRQEPLERDSTAETATLAGKSMKDASDSSYP